MSLVIILWVRVPRQHHSPSWEVAKGQKPLMYPIPGRENIPFIHRASQQKSLMKLVTKAALQCSYSRRSVNIQVDHLQIYEAHAMFLQVDW